MVPCGYNNRKNNVEKGKIWRVGVAGDTPFQFFPFFVPHFPHFIRTFAADSKKDNKNSYR